MTVRCEYCGSRCMDERGNCGACGAPLPERPPLLIKHDTSDWYKALEQWNVGGLVSKEYARQEILRINAEGNYEPVS